MHISAKTMLTAADVQKILDVDRSTIYRMAADGRLPAVRVGRQWRFVADEVRELFQMGVLPVETTIDVDDAIAILEVVAPLLGVMMVVADLHGRPLTGVVNPIPWLVEQPDPHGTIGRCFGEWREMAEAADLSPRFSPSALGFECARAFVRSGSELVGMVLAGGVAPESDSASPFVILDQVARTRVLETLPKVASLISRFSTNKRSI